MESKSQAEMKKKMFNYFDIIKFNDSDPIIVKDEKCVCIYQFIYVTNLRLFQSRTWIFIGICQGHFYAPYFEVRGSCSSC